MPGSEAFFLCVRNCSDDQWRGNATLFAAARTVRTAFDVVLSKKGGFWILELFQYQADPALPRQFDEIGGDGDIEDAHAHRRE